MSKAFTKESDHAADDPIPVRIATLPAGAKNYLTRRGAEKLRAELKSLVETQRPAVQAQAANEATRRALQLLDQRIVQLRQSLDRAEVVPPPEHVDDIIRFGATVTVTDSAGDQVRYRIVGVDEVDYKHDEISWQSPLAKALLNARKGDRVRIRLPAGEEELQILDAQYEG